MGDENLSGPVSYILLLYFLYQHAFYLFSVYESYNDNGPYLAVGELTGVV